MTMKKSTGYVTELRRCTGSQRFGIEPHEAPVSTFPKQPSRKYGLGVMCAEHWKAYVKGLREARQAATGAKPTPVATRSTTTPVAPAKGEPAAKKAPKPAANTTEVAAAEAPITEVDAPPADEHMARVGDADVRRAFEMTAVAWMLAD